VKKFKKIPANRCGPKMKILQPPKVCRCTVGLDDMDDPLACPITECAEGTGPLSPSEQTAAFASFPWMCLRVTVVQQCYFRNNIVLLLST